MNDERKDHLDQKGPKQRNHPNNYRPITCPPLMWKILTAQKKEEIHYSILSVECALTNRNDAAKDPEALQSYLT